MLFNITLWDLLETHRSGVLMFQFFPLCAFYVPSQLSQAFVKPCPLNWLLGSYHPGGAGVTKGSSSSKPMLSQYLNSPVLISRCVLAKMSEKQLLGTEPSCTIKQDTEKHTENNQRHCLRASSTPLASTKHIIHRKHQPCVTSKAKCKTDVIEKNKTGRFNHENTRKSHLRCGDLYYDSKK